MDVDAHLFRREAGRMVSTLTRIFGVHNLAVAENVVQDAFSVTRKTVKIRWEPIMEISIREFDQIATCVVLVGKLDILGAEKIGSPLAAVAGKGGHIVVDMRGVDFISSIAIRHLVMAANVVARRSGKLVLLNPNPLVTEVLLAAGLEDLLPIVRSEDEARAAFVRIA